MSENILNHIDYWSNQKRLYEQNVKNNYGCVRSITMLINKIDQRLYKLVLELEVIKSNETQIKHLPEKSHMCSIT